jgi:glycosyltransferase involved in cell wall biosynthesis
LICIHLYGHLSAGFGLAAGAAATQRCLLAAGCQVIPRDLRISSHPSLMGQGSPHASASDPCRAAPSALPADSEISEAHLDLVHTNPNVLSASPGLLNITELCAPLRVAYWAWELESFPEGWQAQFEHFDEIWCPSAYCAQSLARRSPIPVIAVPHLPDWHRLDALHQRRQQQHRPAAAPFRFLCLFDHWSTPERKNPAGTIEAFQAAFPLTQGDQPSVELWIKSNSSDQFPQQHHQLRQRSADDPRIHWVDQLLQPAALDDLLCNADALISLHRAEGFGLNLADAMAIGLPVVATAYSANLEFMPFGSAALIPWQPVRLNHNCGDYRSGDLWAEPDLASAALALRRLVLDPAYAADLAGQGAKAIRERLASDRLVPIVRERLTQLMLRPSRRQLMAQIPASDRQA